MSSKMQGTFGDEELREWGLVLVGSSSWLLLLACVTTESSNLRRASMSSCDRGVSISQTGGRRLPSEGDTRCMSSYSNLPRTLSSSGRAGLRGETAMPVLQGCNSDTALIRQCGAVGISLLCTHSKGSGPLPGMSEVVLQYVDRICSYMLFVPQGGSKR